MKTAKPNARFWNHTGTTWVKLTLTPGQTMTIEHGGPTDEGYSYTTETYEYVIEDDEGPNRIVCTYYNSSRDCDGPMISGRTFWCALDHLHDRDMSEVFDAAGWPEEHKACRGVFAPDWQKGVGYQRDVYAESMNY